MSLSAAFEKAGYVRPQSVGDRLIALMRNALADELPCGTQFDEYKAKLRLRKMAKQNAEQNKNWDVQRSAFIAAVQNDPELLWAMFEPYKNQAIQLVLSKANAEIRAEQIARQQKPPVQHAHADQAGSDRRPTDRGGQPDSDHHDAAAPSNPTGSVHYQRENHIGTDRPSAARSVTNAAIVCSVARLSLLDTFKINGRAIGDLTSTEAMSWASSRERDARFVRLLTQNLPPDRPIREFRRGDEVDRIYQQAEKAGE